jgi:hypothetical protein
MTNMITIEVKLTPNIGKPSGYQFGYSSDSGLVAPDGSIDLNNYDKENVVLVFVLQPVQGQHPVFDADPTDPKDAERAIWLAEWPKNLPQPAPCPMAPGLAHASFKAFSLPASNQLKFTDKNKDNKRYAYALRCVVPPSPDVIVDDPVIINKIGSSPA